jgi:hypothetical protein
MLGAVASDGWGLKYEKPRVKERFRKSTEDHGTHYFLTTSAIPLGRGEGWYKNTLVSLNSASYGITSHLAISAGIDLFSMIITRSQGLWYSRLQLSASVGDNFHIGAQVFFVALPLPAGDVSTPPTTAGFGTGMGMITIGNPRNQITLAAGYASDGADRSSPILNAAGMVRVLTNLAIVTEHWLFIDQPQNYPVHSAGVRVIGDLLAIDIGLAYDREIASRIFVLGLPFISGTLNF